jgi:hypothetical protein
MPMFSIARLSRTHMVAAVAAGGLLAGGVALSLSGTAVRAQIGATPSTTPNIIVARFFGSVSSSGPSVPNGTTVTASVNGVVCGVGIVTGGQYTVDLQELPGCINPGKKVDFLVGGRIASPQGAIPSLQGAAVQVNLTVSQATPTPSATPSPTSTPVATTPVATASPTRATPPTPPPPPSATTRAPTSTPSAIATARPPVLTPTPARKPAERQAQQAAAAPAKPAPALPKTGTGLLSRTLATSGHRERSYAPIVILAAAAALAAAGVWRLRREP